MASSQGRSIDRNLLMQTSQPVSYEGGGLAVAAPSINAGLRRPPDALPTVLVGHAGVSAGRCAGACQ